MCNHYRKDQRHAHRIAFHTRVSLSHPLHANDNSLFRRRIRQLPEGGCVMSYSDLEGKIMDVYHQIDILMTLLEEPIVDINISRVCYMASESWRSVLELRDSYYAGWDNAVKGGGAQEKTPVTPEQPVLMAAE